MDFTLRKVVHSQIEDLKRISVQTFCETFAQNNTTENLQLYLSNNLTEENLATELSLEETHFYFLLIGQKITGYIKINAPKIFNDTGKDNGLEIERIYLLKAFQGLGLGSKLIDFTIAFAKENNMDYIWLGVWEHNLPAIKFYTKIGFHTYGSHIFQFGNEPQTDYLMRYNLQPVV